MTIEEILKKHEVYTPDLELALLRNLELNIAFYLNKIVKKEIEQMKQRTKKEKKDG